MASEIQLQFILPEPPQRAAHSWKADPPGFEGFDLVDESYNSLTYEQRYLDWPQKITMVLSLGVALLFKGFMESVWRATVRFDPEGTSRSKVTIVGKLDAPNRAALAQVAAQNGGPVGLRVGVD